MFDYKIVIDGKEFQFDNDETILQIDEKIEKKMDDGECEFVWVDIKQVGKKIVLPYKYEREVIIISLYELPKILAKNNSEKE